MQGLADLWTTVTNNLSFGIADEAAKNIPDFWAEVAINWSAIIAGIVLLGMLLYGGFLYLTSAGEPQKTEQAQKTLTNAVIGFVIVVLAWSIVSLIMSLFGVGDGGGQGESENPCVPNPCGEWKCVVSDGEADCQPHGAL